MWNVGYRSGQILDAGRTDWSGAAHRPVFWSGWYPTSDRDRSPKALPGHLFDLGHIEVEGTLAEGGPFPVVLMSHGTGGSPESMGWLAHRLAQDGNIVIGAHHHGNTGREPYHAAGFVCGWERALDLSALLSNLSDEGPFAGRFDLDRVHAIGFSIGGYTALALAGALTSMERYFSWAMENGGFASGPREFPDVASQVPYLLESSRPFRTSWARQGESFKDDRIGTVTAIAPAPPVRAFDEGSVGAISVPVTLVAGEADQEAPSRDCADWLQLANPTFRRVRVGNDVGHYTFLGFPAGDVPDDLNFIFSDNPGVNREAVHDATADAVLAAFKRA